MKDMALGWRTPPPVSKPAAVRRVGLGYEGILLGIVILLVGAISLGSQGNFWNPSNITSVLVNTAITAVPAAGMTLVIVTGGIDVSIGSVVGFTATVAGLAFENHWALAEAVPVVLVTGALAGLLNALAITRGKVPPIITTLGTMSIWRAVVYALLGGNWITQVPIGLTNLFVLDKVFGIPWSFILAMGLVLLLTYVTRSRPFGRFVYAIGNNEEAAEVSGLPVNFVKLLVYTLLGLLTAVSALMMLGQSPLIQATTGTGFELTVIAAVVLGGTSILGGRGSIVGSFLGSMLVQLTSDGVILFHIQPFWEGVVSGLMILIAVFISLLNRREESR